MVVSVITRLCLATVFLHLAITVGHSQAVVPLSEIKTTVLDESGAVIRDCEILFKSDSSTIVSHTGGDGSVTLKLPTGKYAVTITGRGFVKSTVHDVQIGTSMHEEIRVVLKVDQTPSDGPLFDGPPTATSDLPSEIAPEPHAVRSAHRSWRCLYLWKCSTS